MLGLHDALALCGVALLAVAVWLAWGWVAVLTYAAFVLITAGIFGAWLAAKRT
jgi:hypothetical protein